MSGAFAKLPARGSKAGRLWKDSDRERQVGNERGSDKRPAYRKHSIH